MREAKVVKITEANYIFHGDSRQLMECLALS